MSRLFTRFAVFALVLGAPAFAASLVATGGNTLWRLDSASGTPSAITTVANKGLDSVIYGNGKYVFTTLEGDIYTYDSVHGNQVLATGSFGQTRDLAMDPGGGSFLVSDYLGGVIYRVDLTSGSLSTLATVNQPQGLAYAGNRLYALGSHSLYELNPTTGAVLNEASPLASDGLTYDSYSGKLWTSSAQGIKSITLDLATVTTFQAGVVQPYPDGLAADGLGNLYIAGYNSNVYQYVIATDTLTVGTALTGLDDIAPASGPGTPPAETPEPASIFLVSAGCAVAFGMRSKAR